MKYHTIVGLRQPNRKIRFAAKMTQEQVIEATNNMASGAFSLWQGFTKSGHFMVIPADNVAYVEYVPDKSAE